MPTVPSTAQLANVALVSALYAGGAIGILHFWNREYDFITQPMSYYAVGMSSWLMTSAILAFAVSVFALACAVERGAVRWSRVGIMFLLGASACLVLASIFPTDVTSDDLPITISGAIHVAASYLASPCLVAAALLLSRRFDDARRRDATRFALALVSWASLVVLVVVNHFDLHVGGIGQRIFLAVVWLWLMLMALHGRQFHSREV